MKILISIICLVSMVFADRCGFGEERPAVSGNLIQEWRQLNQPLAKQSPQKAKRQEKQPAANPDPPLAHKVAQMFSVFQAIGEFVASLTKPDEGLPGPVEQPVVQQFRFVLQTELHFMRVLCKPTPQQYQTIKQAGEVALKQVVQKYVAYQQKMQQGMRAGQENEFADPREVIAQAVAKSVSRTLSAQQAHLYQEEIQKRAAARKRAALLSLVARVDSQLICSAEQRHQLGESINANWQKTWEHQLEKYLHGPQFVPVPPSQCVTPVLTEMQVEVWRNLPKKHSTIFGWLGIQFLQPFEIHDELE